MQIKGNLYIISAPSGAGKTTLVNALITSTPNIIVSISHTTRAPRPLEKNGIDYYFIDRNKFEQMIEAGVFFEYATIFNHLYGTSHIGVEEALSKGQDVILEIDWQGAQQIKQLFPKSIGIFILPPSLAELSARLKARNQDASEIIEQRLADAKEMISHIREYDYLVINDHFDKALQDLKTIITAGRLLQDHQRHCHAALIADFVK